MRSIKLPGAAFIVCAIFLLIGVSIYVHGERFSENVRFFLNPSADTAYEIGAKHFDARSPAAYDINRASYFLHRAALLDPTYPDVQLLLARIAFVRSDFQTALRHINVQIAVHADTPPSAYYVRALVYGFTGEYEKAARDYEVFLKQAPDHWAGNNDYAWVLLQGNRPLDALAAVDKGLEISPNNPWLLNTRAIAQFELNLLDEAYATALLARSAALETTAETWRAAYPGNNPALARDGVQTLRDSTEENLKKIEAALAGATSEIIR